LFSTSTSTTVTPFTSCQTYSHPLENIAQQGYFTYFLMPPPTRGPSASDVGSTLHQAAKATYWSWLQHVQ
jgi:hypothetical protein